MSLQHKKKLTEKSAHAPSLTVSSNATMIYLAYTSADTHVHIIPINLDVHDPTHFSIGPSHEIGITNAQSKHGPSITTMRNYVSPVDNTPTNKTQIAWTGLNGDIYLSDVTMTSQHEIHCSTPAHANLTVKSAGAPLLLNDNDGFYTQNSNELSGLPLWINRLIWLGTDNQINTTFEYDNQLPSSGWQFGQTSNHIPAACLTNNIVWTDITTGKLVFGTIKWDNGFQMPPSIVSHINLAMASSASPAIAPLSVNPNPNVNPGYQELILCWRGKDNDTDLYKVKADLSLSRGNTPTPDNIGEKSSFAPALCTSFSGSVYVAWTDEDGYINFGLLQ